MHIIGWIATGLTVLVCGILARGYALCVLWEWFVVPLFGLPSLTIAYALGLALILSFVLPSRYKKDDRPAKEQFVEQALVIFVQPAFALLFGWIIQLWL